MTFRTKIRYRHTAGFDIKMVPASSRMPPP
jgi:hypothetical protein